MENMKAVCRPSMKSINRQLLLIITSAILFNGCSTKPGALAPPKQAAQEEEVITPAIAVDKIDLSTLKPITAESAKEEIFTYAAALMTNNRFADAESMLLSLTQEYPELAGPYTNLGICYFHLNEAEKAITAFKQSLAVKPNNAIALDYLGRIDRDAGRFASARDHYLKAIEADPGYPPAQRNLAILYDLYLNQPKDALMHYQHYQQRIAEPDKHVAIWIRDLAKRTGIPIDESTKNQEEQP
jgi:tetratricopeptide (TPR) repeat protein